MMRPPYSELRSRKFGLMISRKVSITPHPPTPMHPPDGYPAGTSPSPNFRSANVCVHHAKDHIRGQHGRRRAAQQLSLVHPDNLLHHLMFAQHFEMVTD